MTESRKHTVAKSDSIRITDGAQEIAGKLTKDDPYLIDYLKGWWDIGPPQPWGAAMSFCIEVAHSYGLIRSECDTTPTPLGEGVRRILMEQEHEV